MNFHETLHDRFIFFLLVFAPVKAVTQTPTRAEITTLKEKASGGDAESQNSMEYIFQFGQGVKQDYAEALRWYSLAAEQGFDLAQNNLGTMYAEGVGVKQDNSEALEWFKRAAAQGNEFAASNLEAMKEQGIDITEEKN